MGEQTTTWFTITTQRTRLDSVVLKGESALAWCRRAFQPRATVFVDRWFRTVVRDGAPAEQRASSGVRPAGVALRLVAVPLKRIGCGQAVRRVGKWAATRVAAKTNTCSQLLIAYAVLAAERRYSSSFPFFSRKPLFHALLNKHLAKNN